MQQCKRTTNNRTEPNRNREDCANVTVISGKRLCVTHLHLRVQSTISRRHGKSVVTWSRHSALEESQQWWKTANADRAWKELRGS